MGVRFVRRLGGAVRNAVAGGLAHAGILRRPIASQPSVGHDSMARDADARPASMLAGDADARPAPMRAPGPCKPRTAAAAPSPEPARPGRLARFAGRRRSARRSREQFPDADVMYFTPQAFPSLTPEACAFLNTPLEECDPDILLFMFSGLTDYLLALPEGADTPDPMELFATLWARLGEVRGGAPRQATPADAPDAASIAPADAAPDPSPASPDPLPDMPMAAQPDNAAVIVAIDAPETAPDATPLPQPPLESMQPASPEACPPPAPHNALDAAPSISPLSDARRRDATSPASDHGMIRPAARRSSARASPRAMRSSCRRHVASPAGNRALPISNVHHAANSGYSPSRRGCCAARASPS